MSTSSGATVLSGVPTNAAFGVFLPTQIAQASAAGHRPIDLPNGTAVPPERACPTVRVDTLLFQGLKDETCVRAAASVVTTETMHVALLMAGLGEGQHYRECRS